MKLIKNINRKFSLSAGMRSYINSSLMVLGTCCLALLASCTDDKLEERTPLDPALKEDYQKITLTLNVSTPTTSSTRSGTDSDGDSVDDNGNKIPDEDGKKNENLIENATIYFYEKLADNVTDSEVKIFGNNLKLLANPFEVKRIELGELTTDYILTTEASADDLKKLAGKELYLFVTANFKPQFENGNQTGAHYYYDPRYAIINWNNQNLTDFGEDGNGVIVPMSNKTWFSINLSRLSYDAEEDDDAFLENLIDFIDQFGNKERREINLSDLVDSEGNRFGKLELERSLARIDYKPNKGTDIDIDNLYQVGLIPNLYAKMDALQLFNVRNNSLAFRQTSSGDYRHSYEISYGTNPNNDDIVQDYNPFFRRDHSILFDKENGGNIIIDEDLENGIVGSEIESYRWVLDYNWNDILWERTNGNNGCDYRPTEITGTSIYDLTGTDTRISITDLVSRNILDEKGFIPWRYVSENTVPCIERMTMHYTTGVAFRMILSKANGDPILPADADEDDEENCLFIADEATYKQTQKAAEEAHANWENRKKEAKSSESEFTEPEPAPFNKIWGSLTKLEENNGYWKLKIGDGSKGDEDIAYVKAIKDGDEIKYFEITYWYFIRHNYNALTHQLGKTDPMQYAVVRNNIYKLSVTALNGLPRPFKPDDPDEPQKNYISVETLVLSWARQDRDINL